MARSETKKNAPRPKNTRSDSGTTNRPSAGRGASIVTLALLTLAVAGATLFAHWPALSAGAINLDDQKYLFDNPVLQNPSISAAGTVIGEVFQSSTVRGYYEPLTLISLMLDVAAGGRKDNLTPFHITSLILHLLNTILVMVLLYMIFGRPWVAAGAALIFGVHPLTVEPVAWVWERKTLLSAFFALWCLILYVRYTRRPSASIYAGLSVAFVLALMAKPTVTPLPVLLLLMDFWPLKRLNMRAAIEKLPLLAISGISSVITIVSTARTGSATLLGDYSLLQLPLKVCYLIAFYVCKILWPVKLSSIYVLPQPMSLLQPLVLMAVVGVCALIGLLVFSFRRTHAPVMAALFFIIAMSPTLGVVQYSWVSASDKYVYIPAIGLLIALAALLQRIAGESITVRPAWRPVAVGVGTVAVALLLTVGTRLYLREWQDTKRLSFYMLNLAPKSPYAHFCYGNVLSDEKDYSNAIVHLSRCIELKSDYAFAYNNRASAYAGIHDYDRAIADCTKAIELKPDYAEAYYNRGIEYGEKGNHAQAILDYTKALEIKPNDAKAYNNRSSAYAATKDFDRAIQECTRAIEVNPGQSEAYYNRGSAYVAKRDYDRAIADFAKAIELNPDYVKAYNNRGSAYTAKHDYDRAILDCTKAIELKPEYSEAYFNRGNAYGEKGDRDRAIQDYTKAIEFKPDDAEAYYNRGAACSAKGDYDQTIRDCTKAIELKPDYAVAYYNRGFAYDGKGDFDRAILDYAKAIELKPDYLEAYGNRAAAYGAKGNFDQAISDCTKAIELNSDHTSAYSNRGNAYGAKGDHVQAVRDYTKAIELQPDAPSPYHNRALSYYFLKEYDKSWADVKMCRQLRATPDPELVKKLTEATGRKE